MSTTTNETLPAFLSDAELARRAADLAELCQIRERMHATGNARRTDLEQADAAVVDAEAIVSDAIRRRDEHRQAVAQREARW